MNNTNNISSFAVSQNMAQPADNIKMQAANDVKAIEQLVQTGALTREQGQNLMNYVTEKAFKMYTSTQIPSQTPVSMPKASVSPEFFNRDGRSDVYEYLTNSPIDFDEDEVSKISALVEKIENTAIDRYLREKEHEKALKNENESAKQKLRANAQNSVSDSANNMVYTREKIGKMSGAEFAKHERAIMDQLRKGLIR